MNQVESLEETIYGRAPTEEEGIAIEWVHDLPRKQPAIAQAGLDRMVTLCTALLGGAAFLFSQDKDALPLKIAGAAFLLLALVAALAGSLPAYGRFDTSDMEEVIKARDRRIVFKVWTLYTSAGCLVLALALLLLGAVVG